MHVLDFLESKNRSVREKRPAKIIIQRKGVVVVGYICIYMLEVAEVNTFLRNPGGYSFSSGFQKLYKLGTFWASGTPPTETCSVVSFKLLDMGSTVVVACRNFVSHSPSENCNLKQKPYKRRNIEA